MGSDSHGDPLVTAIDAMTETTSIALEALKTLHRTHEVGGDRVIEIDDDGWMHGDGVTVVKSERDQRLAAALASGNVEGTVWHFTDTRGAGAVNLATRIAKRGDARSCHVWIDARGKIAQSVSFRRGSWHAGSNTAARFSRSSDGTWNPPANGQRGSYGANDIFAGIELECVGELRLIPDKRKGRGPLEPKTCWAGWPYRFDYVPPGETSPELPAVVPFAEVHENADGHTGWHLYSTEQIMAAERVARALATTYRILRPNLAWGHSQIDPKRRTDPGPLWQGDAWDDHTKPLGGHLASILDNVYPDGAHRL